MPNGDILLVSDAGFLLAFCLHRSESRLCVFGCDAAPSWSPSLLRLLYFSAAVDASSGICCFVASTHCGFAVSVYCGSAESSAPGEVSAFVFSFVVADLTQIAFRYAGSGVFISGVCRFRGVACVGFCGVACTGGMCRQLLDLDASPHQRLGLNVRIVIF